MTEFIRLALAQVARTSNDPDTQTACVIVDTRGEVIGGDSNRIPRGVEVNERRTTRPHKYSFIQHAEARAVALAAQEGVKLRGSKMYLNWFPCAQCAQSIVTAGIRVLNADRAAYEARKDDPRYGFAAAMDILTEAGVLIHWNTSHRVGVNIY